MTTTVFDIKKANAADLVAQLTVLQEKAADLATPDSELPKINKEIAEIYVAIRSLKKDRSNELTTIIDKQKNFSFSIKEIFGADAIKSFTDDELISEAQERNLFTGKGETQSETESVSKKVVLTEENMTNLLTIGSYNIDGENVEIKVGDYDRNGKPAKALIGPKREHKKNIVALGEKGFNAALSDAGREFLLINHVGTVGTTAGKLVFSNLAPVITYTGFDKEKLEKELGIDKLRKAHANAKVKA